MIASEAKRLASEWPKKRLEKTLEYFYSRIEEEAGYGETEVNLTISSEHNEIVEKEVIPELIRMGFVAELIKSDNPKFTKLRIDWK